MVAGSKVGLDDPGALSSVNDFGIARSAGLGASGAGLRQGMLQSRSLQPQGNDLLLPWCKTHFISLCPALCARATLSTRASPGGWEHSAHFISKTLLPFLGSNKSHTQGSVSLSKKMKQMGLTHLQTRERNKLFVLPGNLECS